MDRVDQINVFQGTASDARLSTGNTYPAVGRPWGMTYWSPQTGEGPWIYSPAVSPRGVFLQGLRATHQASPWMGDWGHFLLQPFVGSPRQDMDGRSSLCRMADLSADPSAVCGTLRAWDVDFELTATTRCAVLRLRFGQRGLPGLAVRLFGETCEARFDAASNRIVGCARHITRADRGQPMPGFGCWFVIESDTAWEAGEASDDPAQVVRFPASQGKTVTLRIGTSFISADQALENLKQEVGDASLDEVKSATRAAWNTELNRIDVQGADETVQRTFDSCLYRVLMFPMTLHETSASGETVHWSPYTCDVQPGTMVTNHGFWDTFRTVYPLLSLVWPEKYGELLDAWVRCFEQSGWLPRWASPGHRSCMVGNHLAPVIADAVVKGLTGFDVERAYAGMRQDATEPGSERGWFGRQELKAYHELGYLPDEEDIDSVARTLDYAYNDWCCGVVAKAVGATGDVEVFEDRAGNWVNVFEPVTKFLRGRRRDGSWVEPFDPLDWGRAYVEGSAYQFRFTVPHDLPGMVEAFGGEAGFMEAWAEMVNTPPLFGVGRYRAQVHEMAEMASVDLGQYAQSNQPVHAFAWLPAALGHGERTDALVEKVCRDTYSPDMFPGDEDNGEMAAWYILARLGLYAVCPGDGLWTMTQPTFDSVTIHPDRGRTIHWTRAAWQTLIDSTRQIAHDDLCNRFGK